MTEDQIPAGHDAGSEAPAKTGADVIAGYLKTLP